MNRWPLRSSPSAISLSCSMENRPRLPKHKNTTLLSGWESSQLRHSASPSAFFQDAITGPIA
uniref:Uncharacterized protein n=1 Tax=Nymphaea colorata TaxID=210225 RepID=A0A5K1AL39_9MAGN